MSWGLENRLSRIIQPEDGRTVMLAVDHGYFLGPTSGLECIAESIVPLAPFADTLMLTRGMLRSDIPSTTDTPIVLRVSGANSVLDDDLSNETIITDIDECHPPQRRRHGALDLRRLAAPASDDRQPRQAHRPGRALRHPGRSP